MKDIRTGDTVTWTHFKHIYGGYEMSQRQGTVIDWDGDMAIIKTQRKYAKRARVHVLRLSRVVAALSNDRAAALDAQATQRGERMIPAAIARTFRTSLNAHLSMVTYLGERGWPEAEGNISAAQVALAWLSEQEIEGVVKYEISLFSGTIAHEGMRWPAYGTHRHDDDATIMVMR